MSQDALMEALEPGAIAVVKPIPAVLSEGDGGWVVQRRVGAELVREVVPATRMLYRFLVGAPRLVGCSIFWRL